MSIQSFTAPPKANHAEFGVRRGPRSAARLAARPGEDGPDPAKRESGGDASNPAVDCRRIRAVRAVPQRAAASVAPDETADRHFDDVRLDTAAPSRRRAGTGSPSADLDAGWRRIGRQLIADVRSRGR